MNLFLTYRGSGSSGGVMMFILVRGVRLTAQSLASMRLTGVLSPLLLGDAIAGHVALCGRAQMEALLFVSARLAVHSPRCLALLLERAAGGGGAAAWIARQPLGRQVMAVGLCGTAAPAAATAAVQLSVYAAALAARVAARPAAAALATRQFCHDATTVVAAGGASIVAGGCGAVIGGLLLPGVGTVLGSLVGSIGGGYLPYLLRSSGPCVEWEQNHILMREEEDEHGCRRVLAIAEEEGDWLIIADTNVDSEFIFCDITAADTSNSNVHFCVEEPLVGNASTTSRQSSICWWDCDENYSVEKERYMDAAEYSWMLTSEADAISHLNTVEGKV
ncbi:uncharacterized protein TM35_000091510 [Trypanosoma theileri]|uniref:Uncharacterized protein n=1 Tax=Trypanosoma theileri TaxID=67003 RepID=A0A1X0NZS4_9TRYP|nr:uncharacterized protein TM35_000091510 [Trypanosoma theileri]ORC90101.1 hypothetical protein TM35_000091510 [Trypanosoma theileri]